VNFSEQPPSTQWAALKYRGEDLAEVWFKPESEPFGLTFRIPQRSFQIPGMGQRLTPENLLKTVGIATEEVESWRHGGVSHSGMNGTNAELKEPLPPPAQDVTHLEIYVRLKPPLEAVDSDKNSEAEFLSRKWDELEARWQAVLGLEAGVDSLRQRMDTLRAQMDGSLKMTLRTEVKVNALNADVVQWNRAKSRLHYALPKAREFIHRATWAMGTPERKELEEFFKNYLRPNIPLPQIDKVREQVENLHKDRQVLSAQGVTVYQECSSITAEVQGALRTLESNAATNARKEMRAAREKRKFF
jgi:predicted  nucleic acid-binding Zn-ribbon protein